MALQRCKLELTLIFLHDFVTLQSLVSFYFVLLGYIDVRVCYIDMKVLFDGVYYKICGVLMCSFIWQRWATDYHSITSFILVHVINGILYFGNFML